MLRLERPMDNPIHWSLPAGRMFGIRLRVHLSFLLAAVVFIRMELPEGRLVDPGAIASAAIGGLGMCVLLLGMVLLRELARCVGVRACGGEARQVLLWPLGGLADIRPPRDPAAHMLTVLSGPTVNVLICMVCTAVLIGWSGSLGAVPWHPLHPTTPIEPGIHVSLGQAWLIRVFGLSYFLLLVNLLPILPFDGGRVLRTWLWPRMGYAAAAEVAARTGMIAAVLVGLSALFVEPGWLPAMVAVVGYLTCYHAREADRADDAQDGDEGRDDLDQGLGRDSQLGAHSGRSLSVLQRSRIHKAHQRVEDDRRRRQDHARAVEAVLRKISASGLVSLTPEERRILEAETERRRAESREVSGQLRRPSTDDRTSGVR